MAQAAIVSSTLERALVPSAPVCEGSAEMASYATPPAYLFAALEDAERLLKYAVETGIEIESTIRDHVLHARTASATGWDEQTAANLLSALAKLAARMRPVTAESLKACGTNATRIVVRTYWIVAICLAAIIVPFSAASFVASALSGALRTDIATANDLAVKLRARLGAPVTNGAPKNPPDPDGAIITQLQQFAALIRDIDGRARQLNILVLHLEMRSDRYRDIRGEPARVHETFQLPKGLTDWAGAAADRTVVYQDVRYFATSLLDDVSVFYGAVTVCLLPVLYALLGTCAYLLRTFEQQMTSRTFIPSIANSARFLIAAIGGAVVGLFNNFTIGQGASIPPLAIAFLLGYAVDVFFAFLDGMLQPFTKARASAHTPAASLPGKA
jgi:hypothetical protein